MKKKKLITMLTALVLVAVVGVGATLAYMSSAASLTNAFTVGNVKITLDETEYLNGDVNGSLRTQVGNNGTYGKMYPGKVVIKDPTIHIDENSSDCYLFMKLEGMNNLKLNGFSMANNDGFGVSSVEINSSWKKFDENTIGVDGIYYYVGTDPNAIVCDKDMDIEPLFKYVKYNNEELGNVIGLDDVVIKACAYQAEGIDFDTHFTTQKLDEIFPTVQ